MASVSIIIPIYNVEKYIHQCLDSVVNQTFRDIEIILVDDGSPDNCPEICDEYAEKDQRIRVIHKKNGGVSAARNDGIAAATGEWLYFVDSDDWLELDAIEKLHNTALDQNVDLVLLDYVEWNGSVQKKVRTFPLPFRIEGREKINNYQKTMLCKKFSTPYPPNEECIYSTMCSRFIKSSIIKENNIQFDADVFDFEDGLFGIYALDYVNSIYYCGEQLYNYRFRSGSVTHRYHVNNLKNCIVVCKKIDSFIFSKGKDDGYKQAEYCRRVAFFAALLSSYFFHPDNPYPRKEKLCFTKKCIEQYPFNIAFKNAKISKLENKHKYILVCGKTRFIWGLEMYAKLKQKYKKIHK